MQLPRVINCGGHGCVVVFALNDSFCLVTNFLFESASVICSLADVYIWSSRKRFIFPLSVCLKTADSQNTQGDLLLGRSVPPNCYMWFLALCLFITIVKIPSLCPPPQQNLYKNIFEKLSQGAVVPWQQLWQYRLLPASVTISCLTHLWGKLTKETSLTALTALGFGPRETA